MQPYVAEAFLYTDRPRHPIAWLPPCCPRPPRGGAAAAGTPPSMTHQSGQCSRSHSCDTSALTDCLCGTCMPGGRGTPFAQICVWGGAADVGEGRSGTDAGLRCPGAGCPGQGTVVSPSAGGLGLGLGAGLTYALVATVPPSWHLVLCEAFKRSRGRSPLQGPFSFQVWLLGLGMLVPKMHWPLILAPGFDVTGDGFSWQYR